MFRHPRFHEIFFICFNQQRFIGLRQRYEVRFFSSAINTLKLILYSYTLIGNNLLALFICVIYFCDCSSFSSKKRSYPRYSFQMIGLNVVYYRRKISLLAAHFANGLYFLLWHSICLPANWNHLVAFLHHGLDSTLAVPHLFHLDLLLMLQQYFAFGSWLIWCFVAFLSSSLFSWFVCSYSFARSVESCFAWSEYLCFFRFPLAEKVLL